MSLRYTLAFLALPLFSQVTLKQSADKITVDINGKPFSALVLNDARKPYLYPLVTPSGKNVTRRWPMEQNTGESKDHPHHRGLWFNHGDVNGIDFWGSDPSARNDKGAKIVVKKIHEVKSGKQKGTITADFDWEEKDGTALIHEARTMTFYADDKNRTIDFDIKLTAAKEAKFGDTKEGSFGLRLNDQLREEKGNGKMTNAEGKAGEKQVWGRPSAWVDYAGAIDGEPVGITIMDHPSNPHHPTHWHSRAYGLFAANIFGLRDFYNDKSKDGSVTLKAGEVMRFRYRVLIHPGDTASANLAEEYKKYSAN